MMTIDPDDSAYRSNRREPRQRSPQPLPDDAIVLKADDRPIWTEPFHTEDLPDTPERHRRLPASGWIESSQELRDLGRDLGHDVVHYVRRIGEWYLWRSGPANDGHARYAAIDRRDLARMATLRLFPDGTADGLGPDGSIHYKFRTWKESLRDSD
jgi:hypothetical protein